MYHNIIVCKGDCEILCSYPQQHHQHHVFIAQFEADPHSQAQWKKEQILSFQNLSPSWLLLELQIRLLCHAVLGRQGSGVTKLIGPHLNCIGDIQ